MRGLHATASSRGGVVTEPKCLHCDGLGWVEVHPLKVQSNTYVQWGPCPVCRPPEIDEGAAGLPYNQAQQGEPA